jgi:hypothetical protein
VIIGPVDARLLIVCVKEQRAVECSCDRRNSNGKK